MVSKKFFHKIAILNYLFKNDKAVATQFINELKICPSELYKALKELKTRKWIWYGEIGGVDTRNYYRLTDEARFKMPRFMKKAKLLNKTLVDLENSLDECLGELK